MNPFVFHSPTKVTFGEGSGSGLADIVKELGATRALIVTDAGLVKAGVLNRILVGFGEYDLAEPIIYSDVPPDSEVETVNKAAALAQQNSCNCVVAVGGGSVIDTAKAANICLTFGGSMLEYEGLNNLPSKLLPMVAIPTTAGTGSEVSMVAMVKDAKESKKLLFGSRFLAPDAAILDPELLVSLPAKLTAATGLDAITHGIEAYVAVGTNSIFTDALCLDSIRMLFEHLPTATKNGADLEARAQTLVASTMAGVAFTNSGVGIVHALAHATGARYGTHHGATNSVFLPHGMRFNMDIVAERYASIARFLKLSQSKNDMEAAQRLVTHIEEFSASIGLASRLRDLGVPELHVSELDELAFLASTDPAIMFNPKESSTQDIIEIYERAY